MIPSYCIHCDEPQCDHAGPRYLAPPIYHQLGGDTGPISWRWQIDPHDQQRMDEGSGYTGQAPRIRPTAVPLNLLNDRLENLLDVNENMRIRVSTSYRVQPVKTSRAVERACKAAETGSLNSPGGFLYKRLGEIISESLKGEPA